MTLFFISWFFLFFDNKILFRTPLHCAAHFGRLECARVLLYAGANVNVTSSTGRTTPLHAASARGATKVVHLLCECEADHDLGEWWSSIFVLDIIQGYILYKTRNLTSIIFFFL